MQADNLSVPQQLDLVSPLVVGAARGSLLVVPVALDTQTAVLLARASQTASFTPLVDGVADPVDPGVVADGVVADVDDNDFVELEGGVLTDPVRIEDAKTLHLPADLFFGQRAEALGVLEADDTNGLGLAIDAALLDAALPVTSANPDAVDGVALLSLVAEAAGLLDPGGSGGPVDGGQLAILPVAEPTKEQHHLGLLLFPEFL